MSKIDKVRLNRHKVMYGGALVSGEEAHLVIELARRFIKLVKKRLGSH